MRKFNITIDNNSQIILSDLKSNALTQAKTQLGYTDKDIVFSHTKELFNGLEWLEIRCKEVLTNNPIQVVELWEPCNIGNNSRRGSRISILRLDGYYDDIHFDVGKEKLAEEIYNSLKKYNREITPLEKFHASCI